jgi:outer membrane protein OmpA-like peptidoglycan-associated protein
MVPDLLTEITSQFSGDALNQIAAATNTGPEKTLTALNNLIPAALSSLATRAATTDGANDVIDVIRRNNLTSVNMEDVTRLAGLTNLGGPRSSLTDFIFGGKVDSVFDWISTHTGIKRSSVSSLASICAPVVLGLIGRRIAGSGLSGASLSKLLGSPGSFLQKAPVGLASTLGLAGAATTANRFADDTQQRVVTAPAYATQPARSAWGWLLPLLLGVGAIGLLAYLFAGRQPKPTVTQSAPTRADAPAPAAPALPAPAVPNSSSANLGAFTDVKLPNGTSLNIPSNGVENRLLAFIGDSTRQVDKDTWFSFDRLEFETDSAKLKPSSREQLSNVAAILKAYPQVSLKIGGYTDNTGNAAHNLKLSQDRATSTLNELVGQGIAKSRLAAEGYGQQFPVADNSTPEGRQRNRRIDLRVTRK